MNRKSQLPLGNGKALPAEAGSLLQMIVDGWPEEERPRKFALYFLQRVKEGQDEDARWLLERYIQFLGVPSPESRAAFISFFLESYPQLPAYLEGYKKPVVPKSKRRMILALLEYWSGYDKDFGEFVLSILIIISRPTFEIRSKDKRLLKFRQDLIDRDSSFVSSESEIAEEGFELFLQRIDNDLLEKWCTEEHPFDIPFNFFEKVFTAWIGMHSKDEIIHALKAVKMWPDMLDDNLGGYVRGYIRSELPGDLRKADGFMKSIPGLLNPKLRQYNVTIESMEYNAQRLFIRLGSDPMNPSVDKAVTEVREEMERRIREGQFPLPIYRLIVYFSSQENLYYTFVPQLFFAAENA